MINSGRFETTTKTKISTSNGNVLKVTTYPVNEEPYEDYKIRKICSICKKNKICICYNNDNSDNPFKDAFTTLNENIELTCEDPNCVCEFVKKHRPEYYKPLAKKYGEDDVCSICEDLRLKYYQEDDDGIFCEV